MWGTFQGGVVSDPRQCRGGNTRNLRLADANEMLSPHAKLTGDVEAVWRLCFSFGVGLC